MHWFADLIAAIGVVLNGIPQGIMALSLGFAVFPTTFSFLLVCAINFIFNSVAPVSFQAESLALTGNLGRNTKEYTSIIFGGSIIMAIIGLTGTLTKIVGILGNHIITGMMAGVGIMLAKIALEMARNNQKSFTGWVSIAIAVVTYLISNDLVWTICLSVIGSSLYAVFGEHYRNELPANVTMRRFIFTKPTFNPRIVRGALSLACLNIGANLSYGLITGQMTGIKQSRQLKPADDITGIGDMEPVFGRGAGGNHYLGNCQRAGASHRGVSDDADHGRDSVCRLVA